MKSQFVFTMMMQTKSLAQTRAGTFRMRTIQAQPSSLLAFNIRNDPTLTYLLLQKKGMMLPDENLVLPSLIEFL